MSMCLIFTVWGILELRVHSHKLRYCMDKLALIISIAIKLIPKVSQTSDKCLSLISE